jgi:plasmid stabilization system protein ParE
MARLVVAGPARLDVREILVSLGQAAGIAVARRYGARFKAMYRYIAQYPAAAHPAPPSGRTRESASCNHSSSSMTTTSTK